jgi:hypothetical protein
MDDTMFTQASVHVRFAIRSGALRAFDFVSSSGSAGDASAALNAAGGGSRPFHAVPAMSSPDAGTAAPPHSVLTVVAVAPSTPKAMEMLISSLNAAVRALGGAVKQRQGASWRPCPGPEAAAALRQQTEDCIVAEWPRPLWRAVRVLPPDSSAGAIGGAMKRMPAVSLDSIRVDGAGDSESCASIALSISVSMLRHRQLRIPDYAMNHLLTTSVSVMFKEPLECVLLLCASPALLVALHPGWADDVACDDEYSQPGDTADADNIVAEVRLDATGGGNMLVPLSLVSGPGGGASPAGIHVAASVALSLATLVHGASFFGEPGRVHAPTAEDVALPELQRRRCDAAKEFADEDADGSAWTWEDDAPCAPQGRGQVPQGSFFVSAHLAPIGTPYGEADQSDGLDAAAHSLEPDAEAAAPLPAPTQRLQRPFITINVPTEAIEHEVEAPRAMPRRPPPPAAGPATQASLVHKPMFASFKPPGTSPAILPRTVANDKKAAAGKPAIKPAVKPRAEQPTTGEPVEPTAKRPRPAKEELDPVAVDADVRQRAAGGVAALSKLTLPQCKAFLKHNKAPGGLGGNKPALLDRIAAFLGLQAPAPVGAVTADEPVA